MPQIIPIKDLKNTSEISELCHRSNEPIYITKNGYGDMVIMSMDIYENSMKQLNIYRELELSERQVQEGKTLDARASLASKRDEM
jgi:PHD/YefM family antitoxin component YafN of YafNO toxin-antitoxin module